jgi:hypothetical protein
VLWIIAFKLLKTVIVLIGDYAQLQIGFEYYSNIYYNILNQKNIFNGTLLNILENDCEKLTNISYSLINILLNPIEIVVLVSMLVIYVDWNTNYFTLIIVVYIFLFIFNLFVTFRFNLNMMKSKDARLKMNL